MPTTKCSAPFCEYKTEDGALTDRIELLHLHVQVAHPAAAGGASDAAGFALAAQCKAKVTSSLNGIKSRNVGRVSTGL